MAVGHEPLRINVEVLLAFGYDGTVIDGLNVFAHYDSVAEAYCKSDNETQTYLEEELAVLAHTLLVVLEDLDIIVRKSNCPAPKGGKQQ